MKKVLSILIVVLFIFGAVAYAETDLSSLSNDDLLLLEAQIKAEKAARGLPVSAVLTQGSYKVGVGGDIPAGRYTIVYEYSNKKSTLGEYYWFSISVSDVDGEMLLFRELTNENTPHPSYSMELSEGSTLSINYDAAARLVKSEGIVFE